MKYYFSLFLVLQVSILFSQNKPAVIIDKPISADCKTPISIILNKKFTYGLTIAPDGFGVTQEIKASNKLVFEKEHNTAWYILKIGRDGELVFDITPKDTSNDYDFLLYTYIDSMFCEKFQQNKLQPLRSNLSNVTKSIKGMTGLKYNAPGNSIGKGVGNAYSKPIKVLKGEKYMLVLDNITPHGKGHIISFNFLKEVEINGQVLNSDNIPIIAEITLSDNKGSSVEETKSDKNGNYSIKTSIKENQNYSLSVLSDSTFVQTKTINTKDLKSEAVFENIRVVLPKLKKGGKYKLGNINFYGDVAVLLPESYPSVEALFKLMKKNKKMIIQIEGHVNAPVDERHIYLQRLSEERAKTIYDFLLSKGTEKERMTTIGLSNKEMLFPNPNDEFEASANRRVEIKVISIK